MSEKKENRPPGPLPKRLGREFALQFLYQQDFSGFDFEDAALRRFFGQIAESEGYKDGKISRKARRFAEKTISGIRGRIEEIDEHLKRHSTHWRLDRMAVVDRNLLRLAVYEILYESSIPPVVSINEAVEISKSFCDDESKAFINGILNAVKDEYERGGKE